MSENLKLWEMFEDIDPKFTKGITGKDYSGTSPNAHYVTKCLTEMFGPVGIGFGWNVIAEDIERFGETAIHWCRIEFWHTDRANTYQSYGQTKMAYKTRGKNSYLKVDEDAPKKSLTDAITKAAAQVGVAANIFLGRWDDNRYVQKVNDEYREKEADEKPAPKVLTARMVADEMIAALNQADTYETWNAITTDDRFIADLAKLDEKAPALAIEVKTAKADAKARVGQ